MTGQAARHASRYAIIGMLLVGLAGLGLAATLVAWSLQEESVHTDVHGYHLRAVSLASELAASVAEIRLALASSGSGDPEEMGQAGAALAAAGVAVDEIQALERSHGQPDAAVLARALATRRDRVASLLAGAAGPEGHGRREVDAALDSLSLAADQLRRLHAIDASEHVAGLASGPGRLYAIALAGVLFVAVVGGVGLRTLALLRRALAEEEALYGSLERARTSQQRALRMEALGRLSGGVAHDFNNLLTVILAHSQLIEQALESDSPLRVETEGIQRAVGQASDLTRQLLAFSRADPSEPRRIDLNELMSQMEILLSRLLRSGSSLEIRAGPELGAVLADPRAIERALVNLVLNAADAMPDGGRVTIETANGRRRSDDGGPAGAAAKDDFVRLSVRDSGRGMSEATRSRAFDPFFTTKPEGEGTGLGLSAVHGIVTQAGGWVELASEPGVGTRIDLYLPRCDDEPEDAVEVDTRPQALGPWTMLVVDDEEMIRSFCARTLRKAGFPVLEAPDAASALELLSNSERVDLILTDVKMPGTSGRELAERARALHPTVRVLFMSGYSNVALPTGGRLLPKPFRADALLRAVHATLVGRRD